MVSEQREREIRERMAALGKVPWEIGPYPGSLLLLSDTLVYESANPGPFREIAVTQPGVATAMQHMREDLTCLLDEVAFLRGQLADLCEDSRAVAEVARLRQVLADIVSRIDGKSDAIANYLPEWRGIEQEMSDLKSLCMAQMGLAGVCHYCRGAGGFLVDSGGFNEWGEPIEIWEKCQQCRPEESSK